MKAKAYTTGEAAYFLRQALGPHICGEWSHALADMRINDESSIFGVRLLPSAMLSVGGRQRPMYLIDTLRIFITEVWRLQSDSGLVKPNIPSQGVVIEFDPDDSRMWKHRKVAISAAPY